MRAFVFAACLMATSAFATEPGRNESGQATHTRLAAASAARTSKDVALVVDKNKGKFYALYARALRDNPGIQGTIVFSLSIAPDGTVTRCTVASTTMNDATLEARLVEHFRSINFGAKGKKAYNAEYPMSFFSDSSRGR